MNKSDNTAFKYSLLLTDNRLKAALIAVVCLAVGILVTLLAWQFKRTLYDERKEMLSMVSQSAAQNFRREIQSQWSHYDIAYSLISESAYNTGSIEQCIDETNIKHDFGNDFYFLVDEDGNYYSSDGVTGKLADFTYYLKTSPDRVEFLSSLPHLNSRQSYLIYRGRFDDVIQLNTESGVKNIVFFAYAQDLTELKNSIGSMFQEACNVFITDSKGTLMYEEYGLQKVIDGNNIFKKFYQCKMPFGEKADDLIQDCKDGKNLIVALDIKGEDFFFCTSPLGISDWALSMLIVPQDIDAKITSDIWKLVLYMLGILLLVGVTLVYFTYSAKVKSQEERMEESSRLVAAIEEASRAKTMFLSNMSHDIRTPINGIMGVTSMARSAVNDPARMTECLDKIDKASGHLLSLINDVLDMSRIESGKTRINTEPSDIVDICNNCFNIIRGQVGQRNIRFETEMYVDHPKVFADEVHLTRIFINILGNSVKFTRDGGRILFRCRETECTDSEMVCRFEIKDTGIGMSKQFLGHIFDAFSQEENRERTKYSGTGLGMAITKQLVELMGGTIEVESEINKGSSFYVTLKFARDFEPVAKEDEEIKAKASIDGVRILLVEDNELNMEISETLLTMNGAVVDKAWDGLEAIDKFTSKDIGTYDVILMDIMMPRMDGYEATRAIRALNREDAAVIPIIAMTANAFEDDIKATKEAGMTAHLSKPIDIDSVMNTIATYVSVRNSEE